MNKKVIDKLSTPKAVKWFWIVITAPIALIVLLLLMIGIGIFGKLPSFGELENPKSNLATEIYSADGEMIGSFHIENRSFVGYEELSPNLVAALVSTEDMRFYSHSGIDFIALARVAVRTIGMGQGQGGGSTISQQVAKNLYPRDTTLNNNALTKPPKLVVAKLKEWITAAMLEHNYTKEEIIAMYLNTMEYGSNAFGIKSAARTFFNKTPHELNMQEAAMLVGVVNAPSRFSPVRNPERALARRNTVISRMKNMGYITSAQRDSVSALPIELDYHPISHNEGTGTYFRAMLSKTMTSPRPTRRQYTNDWDYEQAVKEWDENPIYGWTIKNKKSDGSAYDLYRDGLKIYTTIDANMQRYAEEAQLAEMKNIQKAMDTQVKNYKRLFNNVTKEEIEGIMNRAMKQTDRYRNLKREGASDEEIIKNFKTPTELRVFTYMGERDTVMTPYDSIMHHKRYMRSAIIAMDPSNGYIKSYIGGPDFKYFKYDNAKQGRRQIGSTIKPFVYTFAVDQMGISPNTPVANIQYAVETSTGDAWQPKEASKIEYDGVEHPLWWGLANSRNNYTTWIMKQAKQPQAIADYIHKLGIKSWIDPVPSLILGSSDCTLFELTAAYSMFANRGEYIDPIFVTRIEDRFGNVIANFTPSSYVALSEQTAYTTLGMLGKVVSSGTAGSVGWRVGGERIQNIGGKTGTTQNNSDAWFVGVLPKLVVGTWVGGEDRSVNFIYGGTGSARALPIFTEFMKRVYADPRLGVTKADMFPQSVGVVLERDEIVTSGTDASYNGDEEFFD